MVLVKIEPQPAILRSCDMAHYPAPPTRLDSTRHLEWTAFPAKPKCCMLHVPEPRQRQNSALSFFTFPSITPSAVVSSPFVSLSLSLFSGVNQHRRDVTHPPIFHARMLASSGLGIIRAQSLVANAQTEAVTLLRRC
jgi:hypothetical protein